MLTETKIALAAAVILGAVGAAEASARHDCSPRAKFAGFGAVTADTDRVEAPPC